METALPDPDSMDEKQALHLIREMIQVSQRKLKNDGILIILWGWIMTIQSLILFALRTLVLSYRLTGLLNYLAIIMVLGGLAFTLYYLYSQRKRVRTYIGVSLGYVWGAMLFCLVLINLIQSNVLHKINFELQHPIFMVITAFAIVTTGGILRYKPMIIGGGLFGLSALLSSYLNLPDQFLVEAIAWFMAFVIPGHLLYSKRKN